jgi:myosin-1
MHAHDTARHDPPEQIRNDNSSRFGKYMEVQFDHKGEPLGGRILNYLLEKVRVVSQMPDERNFHIFYCLLKGGAGGQYGLHGAPEKWNYANQGNASHVKTIDDAKDFTEVEKALRNEGFSPQEAGNLLSSVAAVLLLGQLTIVAKGHDHSQVW